VTLQTRILSLDGPTAETNRRFSGSLTDSQQYIIHSTIPISMVAATIPKASAPRNTFLPLSSPISSAVRTFVRLIAIAAVGAAVACTEATAPTRAAFLVLDDKGQSDWQSVSVGGDHSCGLKTDGSAWCWGSNRYYQLGVTATDTLCGSEKSFYACALSPKLVQPGVKFASISVGARHTCAITTAREAFCWGANDLGQTSEIAPTGPVPVKVAGSLGWTQISAGYSHSCAVRTDGALYCWGANDRGQLGNGVLGSVSGLVRVQVQSPVASVSTGQQRTCARTTTGVVYCWGAVWINRADGLEMTRSQPAPQLVPNAPAMSWLSVGSFTTCGADASGFAYCWEANPRGEMGNGTQEGSTSPQRVASNLEFIQVSAGIVQSCGVVTSGAGYCWGDNTFGQLGVSPAATIERCGGQTLPCSTVPVPVFGRQQFVEISTGFGSHACGVTVRGNLYCWGLGVSGQRGDGTFGYVATAPMRVVEPRR
jgi:alpha-tubulin suppressor-like RCC1 family protein